MKPFFGLLPHEAVHVHFPLRARIHPTVHYRRNGESQALAGGGGAAARYGTRRAVQVRGQGPVLPGRVWFGGVKDRFNGLWVAFDDGEEHTRRPFRLPSALLPIPYT